MSFTHFFFDFTPKIWVDCGSFITIFFYFAPNKLFVVPLFFSPILLLIIFFFYFTPKHVFLSIFFSNCAPKYFFSILTLYFFSRFWLYILVPSVAPIYVNSFTTIFYSILPITIFFSIIFFFFLPLTIPDCLGFF